jgi:hypothetical protein
MNNTAFAVYFKGATNDLLEAVASANPSKHLDAAAYGARMARRLAGNIIEESLAEKLLTSIYDVRPLVTA